MNRIIFWLNKIITILVVRMKNSMGSSWHLVSGIYLPIYSEIGFDTLRWILNEQYEIGEIDIVKAKLEQNDIVLEVGTGLGFVSAYCAKIVGSENVFTFEANPLNVELAKRVFEKNKVHPYIENAMLGNQNGETSFPINKKSRLASSINVSQEENATVKILPINKVIQDKKPSFLAMDIEGAEYDVFKIINFQTIQKIQFELHPLILGKGKCDEIFDILRNNGFLLDNQISKGQNYFFYIADIK